MTEKPSDLKGEIGKSTIFVRDLNTPLSERATARTIRREVSEEGENPKGTMRQEARVHIYKTLRLTTG